MINSIPGPQGKFSDEVIFELCGLLNKSRQVLFVIILLMYKIHGEEHINHDAYLAPFS